MRVLAKACLKRLLQRLAFPAHLRQKVPIQNRLDDRKPRGRGDRMADIGMSVLEEAAARGDRVIDGLAAQHRTDRLISGAQALGDTKNIGCDAVLFAGE